MKQTEDRNFAQRLLPWCGSRKIDGISGIRYGLGLCNMEQFQEVARVINLLESEDQSPAVIYERRLLEAMLSDEEEVLYQRSVFSLLVLRHAFTSEWSQECADPAETKDIIRKIFLAFGGAYQRDIKDVAAETAVLRFAYEMTLRFLDDPDACPTYELTISPELMGASPQDGPTYDTLPLKDYNLSELIRNNAEHVEELIALAAKHKTTDSAILSKLLISPETPLSLTGGVI